MFLNDYVGVTTIDASVRDLDAQILILVLLQLFLDICTLKTASWIRWFKKKGGLILIVCDAEIEL